MTMAIESPAPLLEVVEGRQQQSACPKTSSRDPFEFESWNRQRKRASSYLVPYLPLERKQLASAKVPQAGTGINSRHADLLCPGSHFCVVRVVESGEIR